MNKEQLWLLLQKAGVMFGFTYFSVAISTQNWIAFTPSGMAAGLYFFTELYRIYNINKANSKLKAGHRKQKTFTFLL